MLVVIAYFVVVITWSTTPLAVVWSSETVDPILAALLRMFIAAILGWLYIIMSKTKVDWSKRAFAVYGYSLLGVYASMLCVYIGARYIPSGLMSLLFGLSPILSGLIAQKVMSEPKFGVIRWIAILISLAGLATVSIETLNLQQDAWIGICLVLCAVLLFSISAVYVKKTQVQLPPITTTVASLTLSLPLYFVTWLIAGEPVVIDQWQAKSVWSIVYLGIFGSLIGFVAYFYILNKLQASTVTLVTLITPVMALILGLKLNSEPLTHVIFIGSGLLLIGLAIYCFHKKIRQFVETKIKRRQHKYTVNNN